ncbi:MAG: AraC family transcriptional regulator [Verrucomicrobiota bacterium]
MSELTELLERHCRDEVTATVIPRLMLTRWDEKTEPSAVVFFPLLCVVARGRKRVMLGDQEFYYDPETYLIASADLPVCGEVIEAPYLGVAMALDTRVLAELLLEMPPLKDGLAASRALAVSVFGRDLLDPLLRLLRLLDRPEEIPVMAPLIEREILYRLLQGPRGAMLRQLALPASQLSQISRAIHLIRARYDEALRIEDLAQAAGMSAPSFHRHFRAVTTMSPLQFQKQIRLQHARQMLLANQADAASVGFEVGYESPSQFSREYRRMFGEPPGRDKSRARLSLMESGG